MRLLALGLVIGAAIAWGTTALAGSGSTTFAPLSCKTSATGYVCVVPRIPTRTANGRLQEYTIKVAALDLSCTIDGDDPGVLPAGMGCDRLTVDTAKCVDGIFGSLSTWTTTRRMETDTPQHCVTTVASPGYKFTKGYVPHVYFRNP
jgi:hypothetical protein